MDAYWSKGRQLASMSSAGQHMTTYDADGNRITKTVNGVTTSYTYVDGRVTHETNGTDTITTATFQRHAANHEPERCKALLPV